MGRQRELLRLSIILCMGLLFVMAGILLIVKAGRETSGVHCGRCAHDRMGASLRHPRIKIVDARTRHRPGTPTGGHVGGARWRRPDACLTSSHCGLLGAIVIMVGGRR